MSKNVISFCPYSGSVLNENEKTTTDLLRHSEAMINKLDIVMGGSGGFRKWLFNPFSGEQRSPQDISNDPLGLGIVKAIENMKPYNDSLDSSDDLPIGKIKTMMRIGKFIIANMYLYSDDPINNENLKELFSRVKILRAIDIGYGVTSYEAISEDFDEVEVISYSVNPYSYKPENVIPEYRFIVSQTYQTSLDLETGKSTSEVVEGSKFSYNFEKVSSST